MIDLLRRAWDALASFKQAYPENWNEDDEQVMKDLMRADLQLSGVKLKWQGLTDEELDQAMDYWSDPSRSAYGGADRANGEYVDMKETWRYIEAKLKEKNYG